MARWFDHAGHIYEAPWVEGRQTTTRALVTHYVFGEQSESPVAQAITLCGKRAGLIPGDVDVDCPECLDAIAEDEAP
jgi:hypothetical protein